MPALGTVSLLLHAHLPWIRHPEDEDFLEEDWLYEAVTECYVPLLVELERLAERGVPFRLGLSVSPTLCEMLADPLLMARASRRLGALVELAERTERGCRGGAFEAAAKDAARTLRWTWVHLEERFGRAILPRLRALAEAGHVELLTTAATHGVLPLMATDETRMAQLLAARLCHARHFGAPPAGLWLPECGYAPGLGALVREAGYAWTTVERHALYFGQPPAPHGVLAPVRTPGGLVVFGRDGESSEQVWSASAGFPGDPVYREYHRDAGWDLPLDEVRPFLHRDGVRRRVGLRLHRVSGAVDLADKLPYEPLAAQARAREHGLAFAAARRDQLRAGAEVLGIAPHLHAPYDAELFGHWWHEGPIFLASALEALARDPEVGLVLPGARATGEVQPESVEPALSSWGRGGWFEMWLNPKNDWMYRYLHHAEDRMVELASRPGVVGPTRRALAAAGRELLLAWSSDWAFILTQDTASSYAERRLREHLWRFHQLADAVERGGDLTALCEEMERLTPVFPEVGPELWARRPGPQSCRSVTIPETAADNRL